ncbi:carbohydrate kinase family protein [Nonomuraea sp. NPDC049758]|uniref:carbohydrate kinase family protein n=1 Tax=Nonomuraea sp. NPDC049758 TaxID=3154360 RepID=UPI003435379B
MTAAVTGGFDLLVVGDANPDIVLTGAPRDLAYGQREQLVAGGDLVLGGSGAITACGAARLGLRTAFAGVSCSARWPSAGWTSPTASPTPSTTAMTVVLADGTDRAILTSPGCLPYLTAADVPRGLARHVHVSSYFLQPGLADGLPALLAELRAAGATTSLDTNDDPAGRWDGLADVLAATDVFLPNAGEARAIAARLSGVRDGPLEAVAARLGALGPAVVVKDGAAGGTAAQPTWDDL